MRRIAGMLAFSMIGMFATARLWSADQAPPIAVRAEMLTVTPATGPLMHVQVKNVSAAPFEGQIAVTFPQGWKVNKPRQPISVPAGKTLRVPFAIEKGINAADNMYPLVIEVTAGQSRWVFNQAIVCASAPYLDIAIDGTFDDWKDSIPVTFTTGPKKTIVRTAYTRRNFFILIGVEEDAHQPTLDNKTPHDAVQIAIAPRDAVTPEKAGEKSPRFELLLAGVAGPDAKCFALTRPGELLGEKPVELTENREMPKAKLWIARKEQFTWYECAIPLKQLPGIEPEPGREFCLSVLVHDPGGTGLRDWGSAAGLWPGQRSAQAWVPWIGSKWPRELPFDSAIEWGFCSSAQ